MSLPQVKTIKLDNIYLEDKECIGVPLSEMGNNKVELYIKQIKKELNVSYDDDVKELIDTFNRDNDSEEDIKETYLKTKITMKFAMKGEELSDEEYAKQVKRYSKKYLDGKEISQIIKELSEMTIDAQMQTAITIASVRATLFEVLRKKDNPSEKLFDKMETLRETFSQMEMLDIFKEYATINDPTEDDIKN